MAEFKYLALDSSGNRIKGIHMSESRSEAILQLRDNGLKIIEIDERKGSMANPFEKITIKDLAVFCRQFHTLISAGSTIINTLDVLRLQTEKKKFKVILNEVYEDVQKGLVFSDALKKHPDSFHNILISMVRAGEYSGNLDNIMDRMAVYYEKENQLRNKISGAMVYPIVLSVMAIGVVTFLMTFIMPTFVELFTTSGVQLPLVTRILLGISNILKNYWYIVFGVLGGFIFFMAKFLSKGEGARLFDKFKINSPIIGSLNNKIITARFSRTLAILLNSGASLIDSIEIVSNVVGNSIVRDKLMEARESMKKGVLISASINKINFFTPMVVSMIKIGEESGELDSILDKTANFFDDEVETSLHKLVVMIEPLLIVVMGGLVGFIVIAMLLPLFDIMNTVKS